MTMDRELAAVPWAALRGAYGSAHDFPDRIRGFWTDNEDVRSDVIYGFLFSTATHQYTLYSATPFVIPFALQALGDAGLRNRDREYDPSIVVGLLGFLRTCASTGDRGIHGKPHPRAPRISDAVCAGRGLFQELAGDEDGEIADLAKWLWCYCEEQS